MYFEFQVEKPVAPAAGNAAPVFPQILRRAGVEGEVLVQFVVDENGVVMPGTTKVMKATHALFQQAVVDAVPSYRFSPALVGGRPVKQLVQQPFVFALAGARPGAETSSSKIGIVRPTPAPEGGYVEFQLSRPATPAPGSPAPRYPAALKAERIEGEVLMQFVVDQDGTVMAGSQKVIRATNPAFVEAVVASLPNLRFNPATVNGRAVRQLVQMPYEFAVERGPAAAGGQGAPSGTAAAADDKKGGVHELQPIRVIIP